MKRIIEFLLICLLILIGTVTILNVVIMYWFPVTLPLSSFVAMRLCMVAIIEKTYWQILISLLIPLAMIAVAICVKKQYYLFPLLFTSYFIWDLIVLCPLLFEDLHTYQVYIWTYLSRITVDVVMVIFIGVFCWFIRKNKICEFIRNGVRRKE